MLDKILSIFIIFFYKFPLFYIPFPPYFFLLVDSWVNLNNEHQRAPKRYTRVLIESIEDICYGHGDVSLSL